MAEDTLFIICTINSGFFSNAEPSPLFTTLGTGQPILISKISKSLSSMDFATSAINSGSLPKSCMDTGCSQGSIFIKAMVFLLWKEIALALIISIQINPAPCSLHSVRNGISVTPAIGASTNGFSIRTLPIFQLISLPRISFCLWLHCAFFNPASIFIPRYAELFSDHPL